MSKKALLVYPQFPPSYWSFRYALKFVGKKAAMPPLGLLTVAALFPSDWRLKVVDMNVEPLTDEHLQWADAVFTSTMLVQKVSLNEVISRCNKRGVPVILGGPYPWNYHQEIQNFTHVLIGEVENWFADFLDAFEHGTAPRIYEPPKDEKGNFIRPSMQQVPLPRYDLINLRRYASAALQFSRGCPFDCGFCDIWTSFGRVPRTKTNDQVIAECELVYGLGYRGPLFFVDDNLIGNKKRALELVPFLTEWQQKHNWPFTFYTEASVNLASLEPLMAGMVGAHFDDVFLGLETPNPKVLIGINKGQNVDQKTNDPNFLLHAVQKIQKAGMQVKAGFILGLDGETEDSFNAHINFIQMAGIPFAMEGLLTALRGTTLYDRYIKEGRIIEESTGDNFSVSLNFKSELPREVLLAGYKRVITTLYDPQLKNYFERCLKLFENWQPKRLRRQVGLAEIRALLKSLFVQIFSRQGPAYLKFLVQVVKNHPRMIGEAIALAIVGYHFQKVTSQQVAVDDFKSLLSAELEKLKQFQSDRIEELRGHLEMLFKTIRRRRAQIHDDFAHLVEGSLQAFREAADAHLIQLGSSVRLPAYI